MRFSTLGALMPQRISEAPSRLPLIAAFAAIYLIWGSTYLSIRYAIETIPPFFMAGARFLIAGGMLFVWARLQGASLPTRINWRAAAIIGGLLLVGGNGGVTWSEQSVPSGLVALMVALVPVWVTLIDWLRPNGIRPSAPMMAGVLLGFIGMVLLIVSGQNEQGTAQINLLGALVVMGASLTWSIGSVYSRHAPLPDEPLMSTAMEMLAGGVLLSLASLVAGEWPRVHFGAISIKSWLALAYLIVFGSIIAFSAYTWLLKVTSPVRAATYAYVNPVVAVILGWALAGEGLSVWMVIAAIIIVAAVVVITTYRSRATAKAAPEPDATPIKEPERLLSSFTDAERQGAKQRTTQA